MGTGTFPQPPLPPPPQVFSRASPTVQCVHFYCCQTVLRHSGHAALLTLVLAGAAMATSATEFKFGDAIEGSLNGTATAGTTIRTESADPALLGTLSPGRVGLPPGQLAGNSGGNDLNFT